MSAFLHSVSYFRKLTSYMVIIVPFVGHHAMAAVFYAVFPAEITAAVFSQHIERAVTKQTVEIVRIIRLVTGEKLTIPVAEKLVVLCFFIHGFHPFAA